MRQGRFAGLIGNVNVTAAMAGGAAMLALSGWIALRNGAHPRARHDDRWWNLFYGVCLFLAMSALVLTASRFPILVTAALVAVLLAGQWLASGRGAFPASRLVIGAVVLALITPFFLSGVLLERIEILGPDGYARGAYWAEFAAFVREAPWMGYGPGSFASANAYFLRDVTRPPVILQINSPHSILLQLLLTGGIPYFLMVLAGFGMIARQILRGFGRSGPDIAQAGLVLAFVLIAACGLIDIVLDMPASTGVALFIGGLAWAGALESGAGGEQVFRRDRRRART